VTLQVALSPEAQRAASEVARFVVPGLLSLIGAYLGALIALRSFKKQRAFDRRLDWYQRAVSQLAVYRGQLAETAMVARRGDTDRLMALAQTVEVRKDDLRTIVAEAWLFAYPQTLNAMSRVGRLMVALGESGTSRESPSAGLGSALAQSDAIVAEIDAVVETIARDFRSHLGIERLPKA
jgi:hypothetical protein